MARARSCSSVGNVGEAPRSSLPDGGALGRTRGRRPGRCARSPRAPLPRGVRPVVASRHRPVGGDADRRSRTGTRPADLATVSRRARRRAARRAASSAARSRNAGAGSLPPDLGRRAARPRASHGCPAREVQAADLLDEDAAVGRNVPRRRRGRRDVALRRRPRPLGRVRASRPRGGARGRGRGRTPRRVPSRRTSSSRSARRRSGGAPPR